MFVDSAVTMAEVASHESIAPAARRRLVLHVRSVTGPGGGPEKTILNSPRFYGEFGYRALCVYLHPPGDRGIEGIKRRAAKSGAHMFPMVDCGPWDLRLVAALAGICRRLRVKLWHSHDYKSNALGIAVRRFANLALVSTVHGWVKHTARTPLYHAIDKWCLPWFDQVICVSEDLHQECRRVGVAAEKCTVIHNGIDTDQAQRRLDREEAKLRLGAPLNAQLIGAVGRLSAEKGFDKLIEAAVVMRRKGRAVHLWIAGEGDARTSLEMMIRRLGCGEYVQLLGQLEDPATFYQAMDVFALSSYREGLPNVLLEAMAHETPVVATCVAGVPMVIRDREDGVLVQPGQAGELVRGLSMILGDACLAVRLAESARRRIEERFSFRERTRQVCEIHNRALAGRGIRRIGADAD